MNRDILGLLLDVGLLALLLAIGFGSGTFAERRHYRSIRRRERELRDILLFAVRVPPPGMLPCRTEMVCGNVVVAMDYFKRFLAKLRNLVGGKIGSYETLLDRGRREAVLRMKEEARRRGATCVLNIKFATADIMSGNRDNSGSGCVEVIAYGTAIIPSK